MCDLRDRGDVHQTVVRVRRGFEIDDLGLGADYLGEVFRLGHIDQRHLDAKARQTVGHEGEGAAIERLVDDDLVARLQERPERGGDRPHARGGGEARFGPLKIGDALFQMVQRRIGNAGIEMPRAFAREHVATGLGGLEGEGRAHVDRRVQRALFALRVISVVDGAGGKGFLVLGHGGPP